MTEPAAALPEGGASEEDSAEFSSSEGDEGEDLDDEEEEEVDPALNKYEADGFLVEVRQARTYYSIPCAVLKRAATPF